MNRRAGYSVNDMIIEDDWSSIQKSKTPSPNKNIFRNGSRNNLMSSDQSRSKTKGRTVYCFTCNEEGHYSPDCPNKDRKVVKCYRCHQEGHYANACPDLERKFTQETNITCFNCGEEGHFTPGCPNRNSQGSLRKVVCYRCKEIGHYAPDCPQGSGRKVYSQTSSQFPVSCSVCGEDDHSGPICPHYEMESKSENITCSKCGSEGHNAQNCTYSQSKSTNRLAKCYKCGENHPSSNCKNVSVHIRNSQGKVSIDKETPTREQIKKATKLITKQRLKEAERNEINKSHFSYLFQDEQSEEVEEDEEEYEEREERVEHQPEQMQKVSEEVLVFFTETYPNLLLDHIEGWNGRLSRDRRMIETESLNSEEKAIFYRRVFGSILRAYVNIDKEYEMKQTKLGYCILSWLKEPALPDGYALEFDVVFGWFIYLSNSISSLIRIEYEGDMFDYEKGKYRKERIDLLAVNKAGRQVLVDYNIGNNSAEGWSTFTAARYARWAQERSGKLEGYNIKSIDFLGLKAQRKFTIDLENFQVNETEMSFAYVTRNILNQEIRSGKHLLKQDSKLGWSSYVLMGN